MAAQSASLFAKKHNENRRKSEHLGLSQVSENFDEGLALLKPSAQTSEEAKNLNGISIGNKRKQLIDFITKAKVERVSDKSHSNQAAFDTPAHINQHSRISNATSILALSKQSRQKSNSSEDSDYLSDLERDEEDYNSGDSNEIQGQDE